jgi:glycosidase
MTKNFTVAKQTQDTSKLTLCTLTIKDWYTGKSQIKKIMPKDPEKALNIHSKLNPNAIVSISWNKDGKSAGKTTIPDNMRRDQELVDELEMEVEYFTKKWYGKISKAKMAQIQAEIESETQLIDNESVVMG